MNIVKEFIHHLVLFLRWIPREPSKINVLETDCDRDRNGVLPCLIIGDSDRVLGDIELSYLIREMEDSATCGLVEARLSSNDLICKIRFLSHDVIQSHLVKDDR